MNLKNHWPPCITFINDIYNSIPCYCSVYTVVYNSDTIFKIVQQEEKWRFSVLGCVRITADLDCIRITADLVPRQVKSVNGRQIRNFSLAVWLYESLIQTCTAQNFTNEGFFTCISKNSFGWFPLQFIPLPTFARLKFWTTVAKS